MPETTPAASASASESRRDAPSCTAKAQGRSPAPHSVGEPLQCAPRHKRLRCAIPPTPRRANNEKRARDGLLHVKAMSANFPAGHGNNARVLSGTPSISCSPSYAHLHTRPRTGPCRQIRKRADRCAMHLSPLSPVAKRRGYIANDAQHADTPRRPPTSARKSPTSTLPAYTRVCCGDAAHSPCHYHSHGLRKQVTMQADANSTTTLPIRPPHGLRKQATRGRYERRPEVGDAPPDTLMHISRPSSVAYISPHRHAQCAQHADHPRPHAHILPANPRPASAAAHSPALRSPTYAHSNYHPHGPRKHVTHGPKRRHVMRSSPDTPPPFPRSEERRRRARSTPPHIHASDPAPHGYGVGRSAIGDAPAMHPHRDHDAGNIHAQSPSACRRPHANLSPASARTPSAAPDGIAPSTDVNTTIRPARGAEGAHSRAPSPERAPSGRGEEEEEGDEVGGGGENQGERTFEYEHPAGRGGERVLREGAGVEIGVGMGMSEGVNTTSRRASSTRACCGRRKGGIGGVGKEGRASKRAGKARAMMSTRVAWRGCYASCSRSWAGVSHAAAVPEGVIFRRAPERQAGCGRRWGLGRREAGGEGEWNKKGEDVPGIMGSIGEDDGCGWAGHRKNQGYVSPGREVEEYRAEGGEERSGLVPSQEMVNLKECHRYDEKKELTITRIMAQARVERAVSAQYSMRFQRYQALSQTIQTVAYPPKIQ
ncbi:hypothetical protein C8J57DRAFT_1469293 [Mycena rebaudengoi]|nr:hypothetical protein C8J57DRAFT_1469293 [Mycena rebaudengoi]